MRSTQAVGTASIKRTATAPHTGCWQHQSTPPPLPLRALAVPEHGQSTTKGGHSRADAEAPLELQEQAQRLQQGSLGGARTHTGSQGVEGLIGGLGQSH
jgi:hypothetical protein